MSGIQEILLIALLILVIMVLPRMTQRQSGGRRTVLRSPARRVTLSGRARLAVTLAVVYLLGAAAFFKPWQDSRSDLVLFLYVGIGPVLLCALAYWIYRGFRQH